MPVGSLERRDLQTIMSGNGNFFIKNNRLGNWFNRNPRLSLFVLGIFAGIGCETIMTYMKPPGGETFYDFQRRKACEEKYGYKVPKLPKE